MSVLAEELLISVNIQIKFLQWLGIISTWVSAPNGYSFFLVSRIFSEGVTFLPLRGSSLYRHDSILTNEFAIRPALGENLEYSNTSSGSSGSHKTTCSTEASCLALPPATSGAGSHVATPMRSVAYLCVHTAACMVPADCWAPRAHAALAHVFSQLKTSGASQSHHSSTSSTDVPYNPQAEGEGSSFQSSSAAVQLAWQTAGKQALRRSLSCLPRWVTSPPRRHVVSPRGGWARKLHEITTSLLITKCFFQPVLLDGF